MGNLVFNSGKATFGYYGTLPASTDSLVIVLLKVVESDATLQARLTLSAVLTTGGGTVNVECNATNYARISDSAGDVTVTITSGVVTLTMANQTWALLGGATNNSIVKLLVCYSPASGSADTAIIPLGLYDFVGTTDGSNVTAQVNASGLMSAT